MENSIEPILILPIQLTQTLCRLASHADSYHLECAELKRKADVLARRLGDVARASKASAAGRVCRRPKQRIMQEVEKSVNKALVVVRKCKRNGVIKRVITITSVNDFKRVNLLLDNAIANIAWLLNLSASEGNRIELMGLPPVASSDPMKGLIWEQIALLQLGSEGQREYAAIALRSLARESDIFAKIIVKEDGVAPLLKVLTDGTPSAREAAAKAVGHIAEHTNDEKQVIVDAVAPVFVEVLINAPMKVQAAVVWALAQMVRRSSKQQDLFSEHGAIGPLVALLSETLEQPANVEQVVSVAETTETAVRRNRVENGRGLNPRELNRRNRENENSEVKAKLKAEVARALWMLAKGNSRTSRSITETKALLCFATLIEKDRGDAQFNSVMAVMEIAAVAENDIDLRKAAFKMSSPAVKAVVNQLLRLVEQGQPALLRPCIKAIGCLSRTFPGRETSIVKSLVKQLEGTDAVAAEAVMALEKFACDGNFLHVEHSQAIAEASGATHLVQLIYLGKGVAKVFAVMLMCYLAINVAENEALAKAKPLSALKHFAKSGSQHPTLENLLTKAINRLEIFQERSFPNPYASSYHYQY